MFVRAVADEYRNGFVVLRYRTRPFPWLGPAGESFAITCGLPRTKLVTGMLALYVHAKPSSIRALEQCEYINLTATEIRALTVFLMTIPVLPPKLAFSGFGLLILEAPQIR